MNGEEVPNQEVIQETGHTTKMEPLRDAIGMDITSGGLKRVRESLDSDKYQASKAPLVPSQGYLQLVFFKSSIGGWRNVRNEKGKKGRIEEYLIS